MTPQEGLLSFKFHILFIAFLGCYSLMLAMTSDNLTELGVERWIPTVATSSILVLNSAVLLICQVNSLDGQTHKSLISVVMVLSAALWVLSHEKAQHHWNILLSDCSGHDCNSAEPAWRLVGRLPFQWALCFQVLFLLPFRHALCASSISIAVYEGLWLAMRKEFDAINLVVMIVPVSVCIFGNAVSEMKEWQMQEHLRTLEAASRQTLTWASTLADAQSSTLSLTLSSSLPERLVAGGLLTRQLAQANGCRDAACQVEAEAEPVRDAGAQTDLVWERDGFRCTRCSKPPLAPRVPTSRPREDLQDCRPEGRSLAKGASMRYPFLQETPSSAIIGMVIQVCLSLNIRLPNERCCDLHPLVAAVARQICRKARKIRCVPKAAPAKVFQCSSCYACKDTLSEDEDCAWCDEGVMSLSSLDGLSDSSAEDVHASL